MQLRSCIRKRGGERHTNEAVRKTQMKDVSEGNNGEIMCKGKKKYNRCLFKSKGIWKSGDVGDERGVAHHEVRRKQKRATAQN